MRASKRTGANQHTATIAKTNHNTQFVPLSKSVLNEFSSRHPCAVCSALFFDFVVHILRSNAVIKLILCLFVITKTKIDAPKKIAEKFTRNLRQIGLDLKLLLSSFSFHRI